MGFEKGGGGNRKGYREKRRGGVQGRMRGGDKLQKGVNEKKNGSKKFKEGKWESAGT